MRGLEVESAAPSCAIEVDRLSKYYPLADSQFGRLSQLMTRNAQPKGRVVHALRDVSFSVQRGEAFGIIGANGSGKSTLLQIVAGILRPSSGSATVRGRMSTLLELGSGFSPEFTGRDNVYLNASLLGLSRDDIDARFGDIEKFAGIGDFISQPLKTYSSGMALRLAFAVAAFVDPEILIVDEALAVGDIAFRQRCMRKIHELRAAGATLLFVSHEASDVKAVCDQCLWLDKGVVQELGEADEVVAKYLRATMYRETQTEHREAENDAGTLRMPASDPEIARHRPVIRFRNEPNGYRYGDGRVRLLGGDILNTNGESIDQVQWGDHVTVRLSFRSAAVVPEPIAGFLFRNSRGENIFGSNTARENYPMPAMSAGEEHTVDFLWSVPSLRPDIYRISLGVADGNIQDVRMCDYVEDALTLELLSPWNQADHPSACAVTGYFRLRCAAVTVHRN
ncbi:MAG: ABC transporter ATP-binding protein [Acidobacteriota bacterium]|nr:ABC transporter ATP-binding protein [Acidobacteriota bacterium]